MRIELHCHSTASDGSYAAAEVARRAQAEGIELFCLTDHDTFAGSAGADAVFEGGSATVLRGVELSAREDGRTVHLLVYRPADAAGSEAWRRLETRMDDLVAARRDRMNQMIARLVGRGIAITMADVERVADGAILGRPHLARALVDAGHVRSMREAFDRWLSDRGAAHVSVGRLDVAEALAWARDGGGRVSLAHPHTLGPVMVKDLIGRFRDQGLTGIEAWYGTYSPRERRDWLDVAAEHNLVVTGGSDFHGEAYPDVSRPGIDVPDNIAGPLCEWLAVG